MCTIFWGRSPQIFCGIFLGRCMCTIFGGFGGIPPPMLYVIYLGWKISEWCISMYTHRIWPLIGLKGVIKDLIHSWYLFSLCKAKLLIVSCYKRDAPILRATGSLGLKRYGAPLKPVMNKKMEIYRDNRIYGGLKSTL